MTRPRHSTIEAGVPEDQIRQLLDDAELEVVGDANH